MALLTKQPATPFYVLRFPITSSFSSSPTTLFTWPSSTVGVGDLLLGFSGFVTTAFNGTTPHFTTYVTDNPANIVDNAALSSISADYDTYAGCGIKDSGIDFSGFSSVGIGLLVSGGTGKFKGALTDGAGGSPSSTVGAAEWWFYFAKKP